MVAGLFGPLLSALEAGRDQSALDRMAPLVEKRQKSPSVDQ